MLNVSASWACFLLLDLVFLHIVHVIFRMYIFIISFSSTSLNRSLDQRFGITGIQGRPALIVLNANGTLVSKDGRKRVTQYRESAANYWWFLRVFILLLFAILTSLIKICREFMYSFDESQTQVVPPECIRTVEYMYNNTYSDSVVSSWVWH